MRLCVRIPFVDAGLGVGRQPGLPGRTAWLDRGGCFSGLGFRAPRKNAKTLLDTLVGYYPIVHENDIASEIVDACICVHKEMGPGLLESVYEAALALELAERGHNVQRQLPIHAVYRGKDLGLGFRADVIVDGLVLVEAKSIEALTNVHY